MPPGIRSALPVAVLPSIVLAIDHILGTCPPARVLEGLLDEVAHLATAITLLTPLCPSPDRGATLGALAGAVLLDADHVPGELGAQWLTMGTYRPYPHALVSVLALVGLGFGRGGRWRAVAWPAAAGLTTHLLRDLATDGVSLFWPLTRRNVRIPYRAYAVLLVLAALATPVARRGR
jgi:membrane-bound metal-dependent hydrolase YbcI (DUF457 family)